MSVCHVLKITGILYIANKRLRSQMQCVTKRTAEYPKKKECTKTKQEICVIVEL